MSELGVVTKARFQFRVTSGYILYGNGPFDQSLISLDKDDDIDGWTAGLSQLHLKIQPLDYKLQELLGKDPSVAQIFRYESGEITTGLGVSCRGTLEIGHRARNLLVISTLKPDSFDAITSALMAGDTDLFGRCRLYVGLQEHRDEVNSKIDARRSAQFLLEDLSVCIQIGPSRDWES